MTTIATTTDLTTAVSEYLAREQDTTLIARIPSFIQLTEAKLNRELRCNQMEKRATALVDMGSAEPQYISLPLDFQTMRSIRLNGADGKPRLEFMNNTQADEYITTTGAVSGQPQFFTVFGDEMELLPAPDAAYTLEMKYRALLPSLNSYTSNWLLTLAPDLYVYGCLLEASPYIKDDSRIQVWALGYTTALSGLNQLSSDQTYGSGPLVMRVSTVTP